MAKREFKTVEEHLYWSYANLAMAHSAVTENQSKYKQINYIIRSRLYSGLVKGTMNIASLLDDEKVKLNMPKSCCYCGSEDKLSIDHLIPQKKGGQHTGDNFVWACKSCNSSKHALDMLEWMSKKEIFPPLLLLRRYMKVVVEYCTENKLMDIQLEKVPNLPFSLQHIPHKFPAPKDLILWIKPKEN